MDDNMGGYSFGGTMTEASVRMAVFSSFVTVARRAVMVFRRTSPTAGQSMDLGINEDSRGHKREAPQGDNREGVL